MAFGGRSKSAMRQLVGGNLREWTRRRWGRPRYVCVVGNIGSITNSLAGHHTVGRSLVATLGRGSSLPPGVDGYDMRISAGGLPPGAESNVFCSFALSIGLAAYPRWQTRTRARDVRKCLSFRSVCRLRSTSR